MTCLKLGGEKIIYGINSIEFLSTLTGKKAFIVTSGDIAKKLGQLDTVINQLKKADIECCCFEDVEPDPDIESVLLGAKKMQEFCPDLIIALGGGSAIDAAKAMWIGYEYPHIDSLEKFLHPNVIPPLRKKAILISVPTTSGTGSEVTGASVISDKKRQLKLPFTNPQLISDIVILDGNFTATMPQSLTAATGMDALTHAIESYVSLRSNPISDALCEKAIINIFEYLPIACKEPENLQARQEMLLASTMAGLAFENTSLGIVHSVAHAYGALFHIPHGLANGITLPYIIKYNEKSDIAAKKYKKLAALICKTDLADAVCQLCQEVNIPLSFKEILKDVKYFEEMQEGLFIRASKDVCGRTNPITVPEKDWHDIISQVYFGSLN